MIFDNRIINGIMTHKFLLYINERYIGNFYDVYMDNTDHQIILMDSNNNGVFVMCYDNYTTSLNIEMTGIELRVYK